MSNEQNSLGSQLAQAKAEINKLKTSFIKECNDIEQIAGKALKYPNFCDNQDNFPGSTEHDGVCVGDHVAVSIVAELARKYTEVSLQFAQANAEIERLKCELSYLAERFNTQPDLAVTVALTYVTSVDGILNSLRSEIERLKKEKEEGNFPDIGQDPLKMETRDGFEESFTRLKSGLDRQQKSVPDQTALVWRVDISRVSDEMILTKKRLELATARAVEAKAECDFLRSENQKLKEVLNWYASSLRSEDRLSDNGDKAAEALNKEKEKL